MYVRMKYGGKLTRVNEHVLAVVLPGAQGLPAVGAVKRGLGSLGGGGGACGAGASWGLGGRGEWRRRRLGRLIVLRPGHGVNHHWGAHVEGRGL